MTDIMLLCGLEQLIKSVLIVCCINFGLAIVHLYYIFFPDKEDNNKYPSYDLDIMDLHYLMQKKISDDLDKMENDLAEIKREYDAKMKND